ncbi:MAG: DEAD/DEAH box helicase [Rhodospirillales bacterium]|nr:MAG: DEAD/DEAH box helicase [Rhodospirillales bacterium]
MTEEERSQIDGALRYIPRKEWTKFLRSESGTPLNDELQAVRAALKSAGVVTTGRRPSPRSELVDLFGHDLLGNNQIGPWLREQLLRYAVSQTGWKRLARAFREIGRSNSNGLHGNATQEGQGSKNMAAYWWRGSYWSETFCDEIGLPDCLWQSRFKGRPDDETLERPVQLAPLHSFQKIAYASLRDLLQAGHGRTAVLSLPTGAGKTRVAVEAICDHLADEPDSRRRIVLWVAQSDELLQQAWECFRQVWTSSGQDRPAHSGLPLSLYRAWGGRRIDDLQLSEGLNVVLAGVQQLNSWFRSGHRLGSVLPLRQMVVTVIDEAHHTTAASYGEILVSLGLRHEKRWHALPGAPPVIGLTATPWRSDDKETGSLRRYFQSNLFGPEFLGHKPVKRLQKLGVLGHVTGESLKVGRAPKPTTKQLDNIKRFKDLPQDYLNTLGRHIPRNGAILRRLLDLSPRRRTLVFACSVQHARTLALTLNRAIGEGTAGVVTGRTPVAERYAMIERFRDGRLRFLCNYGVLTAGFDAPRTDTVVVTRPTRSSLLYEQMVGRGLRGPRNGGTSKCLVIDVQDTGLPTQVLSYQRVLEEWAAPVR